MNPNISERPSFASLVRRPDQSGDDLPIALAMVERVPAGPQRAFVAAALNRALSGLSTRDAVNDGFYSFTAFVGALAWIAHLLEPRTNLVQEASRRLYRTIALGRRSGSDPRRDIVDLGRYATKRLEILLDQVAQEHLFVLATAHDARTLWLIGSGVIRPPSADEMLDAMSRETAH